MPFQPSWEQPHTALGPDFDKTRGLNRYRNALHFVDSQVGLAIDALRKSGQMDNTLLIVTSDHGEEFNDTGKNYWGHNGNFSPYQLHVPLLVRGRGWQPGAEVTYFTTHNDLAPTVPDRRARLAHAVAGTVRAGCADRGGRRDFLAVVDQRHRPVRADRVTLFSPFGGFPVYSHDYDRSTSRRMDRVRAVTEILRFSRSPPRQPPQSLVPPPNTPDFQPETSMDCHCDIAPDFELAPRRQDEVPRVARHLVGRAVLAPEGLHAGVPPGAGWRLSPSSTSVA